MVFAALAARAGEEKWLKVSSSHFTILTPAAEKIGRARAVELEQFRRALQEIIPVPEWKVRPVTLVLFKSQRAMEPFLPLEDGRPAQVGGIFRRFSGLNTIALSLDSVASETRHMIFHEAVHWHLSAQEQARPLWVEEGLAELYATFVLPDEKTYELGTLIPWHIGLLRRSRLLPVAELIGLGPESLHFNEGTRATIFYAESWALLHLLLYGVNSPGPEALRRYLALLPTAASPQAAFQTAFGADCATVEKRLREYVSVGNYHRVRYRRTTAEIDKSLRAAAADPVEVELARSALLIGARRAPEAEARLRRAAELAPRDPRAWELLGQTAFYAKDYRTARELLRRAVDAGSKNHFVHFTLAAACLAGADPASADHAPGSIEAEQAAACLRAAIPLEPSFLGAYDSLVALLPLIEFRPDDLKLFLLGHVIAPDHPAIAIGLAVCELRAGHREAGRAKLERLLAQPKDIPPETLRFARESLDRELLRAEAK